MTKPNTTPQSPTRPAPEKLDDSTLEQVSGGKLFFDDGVTTFYDPVTGQVVPKPP